MQQIERLVVHVEEAIRLAERLDEPSQRLSLLLLDSAAELMLHRECEYQLWWERDDFRSLGALLERERRTGLPPELETERQRLESKVTSKKRRKKISSAFDSKAGFLVERRIVPEPTARALQKLHKYRNEAYHRDLIRPATLHAAVKIYAYLVCSLMRDIPVHSIVYTGGQPALPPRLAKYFPDGATFDPELQVVIAASLSARVLSSDPASEIPEALAAHLLDRLEALEEALEYGADFMNDLRPEAWDKESVLRLLQIGDVYKAAFATPETAMAEHAAIGLKNLARWRRGAAALAKQRDIIKAFGRFAYLEDLLEPIETPAMDMVRSIDDEVDRQIEERRGG